MKHFLFNQPNWPINKAVAGECWISCSCSYIIGTAIVKWLKFMIIPGTVDLSWNSLKRFLWTYQDCFHGNHPGIILNLKKEQFMVIYYIIYLHSKMKDWEMKIDWLIFIGRVIDLQSDINQYWPIRMEYSVSLSANIDRTLCQRREYICARSYFWCLPFWYLTRSFFQRIGNSLNQTIILFRLKTFRSYDKKFTVRNFFKFVRFRP